MKIEMPDPKELSRQSDLAIEQAKMVQESRLKAQAKKQKIQDEQDIARAIAILSDVPSKCYRESQRGKKSVIIMELLADRDYALSKSPLQGLTRVGKLVRDQLSVANLMPTIDYEHDGMGMKSWYNLTAHWE